MGPNFKDESFENLLMTELLLQFHMYTAFAWVLLDINGIGKWWYYIAMQFFVPVLIQISYAYIRYMLMHLNRWYEKHASEWPTEFSPVRISLAVFCAVWTFVSMSVYQNENSFLYSIWVFLVFMAAYAVERAWKIFSDLMEWLLGSYPGPDTDRLGSDPEQGTN